MVEKNEGALPSQTLNEFIQKGVIIGANLDNISPASLDLTVSEEAYRVEKIFLPREGESVRNILSYMEYSPHDLTNIMERNVPYLFRLNETLKLPNDIFGYCNSKSTTGRNDVHVRVLADGVSRYDTVAPRGFSGELWVVVIPKSFPIRLTKGTPLSQLRLFNTDSHLKEKEFQKVLTKHNLILTPGGKPYRYSDLSNDNDGSVILTVDLSQNIAGYECRGTNKTLDFSKGVSSHEYTDFFELITSNSGCVHLKKGSFYILSSYEMIRIPPEIACEMVAMDERSGEFRSHYAGYIDPGWGWGKNGEKAGRPLTLEIRPFEDIVIRHGQPIAKIRFEQMADVPDILYDCKESNYINQTGPKLSKHFKVN